MSQLRPHLADLDAVLAKALSKDPADRYARCTDFARALAGQIDALPQRTLSAPTAEAKVQGNTASNPPSPPSSAPSAQQAGSRRWSPAPRKRPKSSYIRFAVEQPNERWQADFTHWWLADQTHVEILNRIDDHAMSVTAHRRVTAPTVVDFFRKSCDTHGIPASTLTDNGMVFTTRLRRQRRTQQAGNELHRLGVIQINSTPNHPT